MTSGASGLSRGVLEPFYFGVHEEIFGAYQAPPPNVDRGVGVVLCYPMGQEYIRSHRAFVQLALRLADEGFHVLRFDFTGCGDSCDVVDGEVSLERWRADILTAVAELKEAVDVVCLCGLRMGASLAATIKVDADQIGALVLWDPIISGNEYLEEVLRQHRTWLGGSFAKSAARKEKSTAQVETLGFLLNEKLVDGIREFDLARVTTLPADNVVVIDTQESNRLDETLEVMKTLSANVRVHRLDGPPIWEKQADVDGNTSVPIGVLDSIVEQLDGLYS